MNRKVRKAIRRHGLGSTAHCWYVGSHWGRRELRKMLPAREALQHEIAQVMKRGAR